MIPLSATGETPVAQRWPAAVAGHRHRRALALVALSLLSALQVLDPSVNSLALPAVAADLGMNPGLQSFTSSIGTLLLAAAMLGIGILGDQRGRRRVLLLGTLGMAVGGVVCAIAPGSGAFLAGRVVMGISTAASFGMSLAILPTLFQPHELPRVFGVWLGVQSAISLLGTVGCGAVQAALGWRMSCLIIPVLAVVFTAFGAVSVPESRAAHHRRFDVVGVIVSAVALLLLMGGFTMSGELGWTDPAVIGALVCSVVLLVFFGVWEARRRDPGFPVRLFTVPAFTAACVVGVAFNFANGVIAVQLPNVLESTLGRSAFVGSIVVSAMSVGMLLGTLAAGEAQKRWELSARTVFTSGLLTIAVGFALLVFVRPDTGSWFFGVAAFVVGFGLMWAQNSESAVIMSAAPKEMVGSVGAVKPAVGQLGMGLGMGIVSPIVQSITRGSGPVSQQATVSGFAMVMLCIALAVAACALVVHLLMGRQKGLQSFDAPPAEADHHDVRAAA
ncbi:MFS transporter [Saccharopolyspora rosea]